jgi:hypothetical protein
MATESLLEITNPEPTFISINTPGATYTMPAMPPASGQVSSGQVSGVVDSSGFAYLSGVLGSYPPGSYDIHWSFPGATPRTDILNIVSGQSLYTFPPLQITATSTSGGAVPANPKPIVSSTPQPSTNPIYPFTFPAYNYGKYFTPTQALMYIGGLFIDELNGFQYSLQSNKVPVFGYCSEMMDAVGIGKSLIQGQFNINFITDGYLYTVLNEHKRKNAPIPDKSSADSLAASNLMDQCAQLLSNNPEATRSTYIQNQIDQIKQQIIQLSANNSSIPSQLSAQSRQSIKGNLNHNTYNAAYSRIPFNIVLEFEGGGRKITKTVRDCVLTGNEQILSDDSVILDGYSFIARSIS